MLVCLVISDVNFYHLVKVGPARFSTINLLFSLCN